jgi:hypothetical protein
LPISEELIARSIPFIRYSIARIKSPMTAVWNHWRLKMLFARNTDKHRVELPRRSVISERAVPLRAAQVCSAAFMGALLAFCFFTAMPAVAGIGGSVVPSFPTPIHVGDLKTAAIRITNRATGTNAAENMIVSGIFITPSCAAVAGTGVSCATPDLGVFQFRRFTAAPALPARTGFSPSASPMARPENSS